MTYYHYFKLDNGLETFKLAKVSDESTANILADYYRQQYGNSVDMIVTYKYKNEVRTILDTRKAVM